MSIGRVPGATGIQPSIVDAKGDLIVATAADSVSRLAVGANNTVLTADSAEATGLKWATVSSGGGGYTLLNSGGTTLANNTSVTISNIGGKKDLFIWYKDVTTLNTNTEISVQFNSSSTGHYVGGGKYVGASTWSSGNVDMTFQNDSDSILISRGGSSHLFRAYGYIKIDGTDSTLIKPFWFAGGTRADGNGHVNYVAGGYFDSASQISSVTFTSSNGNFDLGTVYVYGR